MHIRPKASDEAPAGVANHAARPDGRLQPLGGQRGQDLDRRCAAADPGRLPVLRDGDGAELAKINRDAMRDGRAAKGIVTAAANHEFDTIGDAGRHYGSDMLLRLWGGDEAWLAVEVIAAEIGEECIEVCRCWRRVRDAGLAEKRFNFRHCRSCFVRWRCMTMDTT